MRRRVSNAIRRSSSNPSASSPRNEQLFQRKVLTEIEFNNAKYALAVARANVKSAQVALDRAKQNLSYTQIYAPIDGIVIERTVELGGPSSASMQTPQLFLIANDLSQMQILASVDESDIGAIVDGQDVRFSVQAYPNEHFQRAGESRCACSRRRRRTWSITRSSCASRTAAAS